MMTCPKTSSPRLRALGEASARHACSAVVVGRTGASLDSEQGRPHRGDNVVFISAATIWEAAIKERLGKLDGASHLAAQVRGQNMTELPISFRHAAAAAALPPHHRDPFDRMLVAQAQCESLTFVTRDERAALYGVTLLPA